MILALVGNQNCGKTTLFNRLTGANQHVGNFPGVTVEQKSGLMLGHENCQVVDLPGIYSLRPYSAEEAVTRDFLLDSRPDAIINIADAMNLERNLYLTLQLTDMGFPMVLALNMMDEVAANAGAIDTDALSSLLGIPVVPISAARGEGVSALADTAAATAKEHLLPWHREFSSSAALRRCVRSVTNTVEACAESAGISPRYAAMSLIENNADIVSRLKLNQRELEAAEYSVAEMERECNLDRNTAIADMRYSFIETICRQTVKKPVESRGRRLSRKIDNVLTHKVLSIPIFICIMLCVFYLTFDVIGVLLSRALASGICALTSAADTVLRLCRVSPVVRSLVIDGIFSGVGNVLSFLPIIVVLFFFLSMLEDSGYMARVAFIMDRPMRKLGLSGKSVVPMLIGFGCSVPAVMAARTLSSARDRHMTIMLIPYMSCSAKIPIYSLLAAAFFPEHIALVTLAMYLTGVAAGAVFALVSQSSLFSGDTAPFLMELPTYRMPSVKTTLRLMRDKARDFLHRAFTVIFLASIVIWFLQSFDAQLHIVADSSQSLLADIGSLIAPLFSPLGFDDWRASTCLIAGFMAKEAVVSTMSVLLGGGELGSLFTPLSAASFLVFSLLYTPCVAAVAAIRRELGSAVKTMGVVTLQCAVAWLCGAVVYQIGRLLL